MPIQKSRAAKMLPGFKLFDIATKIVHQKAQSLLRQITFASPSIPLWKMFKRSRHDLIEIVMKL